MRSFIHLLATVVALVVAFYISAIISYNLGDFQINSLFVFFMYGIGVVAFLLHRTLFRKFRLKVQVTSLFILLSLSISFAIAIEVSI